MSVRKQITVLLTMVLALAALSSVASAQCNTGGGSGSTRIGIAVVNDQDESMPVATAFSFDFLSRVHISSFTMFSWGRRPVAQPGNVRSSFAVLRERRGLTR